MENTIQCFYFIDEKLRHPEKARLLPVLIQVSKGIVVGSSEDLNMERKHVVPNYV